MKNGIKKIFIGLLIIILGSATYTYFKISINKGQREDSCFNNLLIQLENGVHPDSIFEEDYNKLQLLVESSLVARTEMLEVANRLKIDNDAPISSRDLLILKEGSESYLKIREGLFTIANAYECAIDVEDATLKNYNIEGNLRLKGLMLSLGAALTLYDNYFLGIVLFEQDGRLRKLVNDPDMGFGLLENKLDEVTLNANSIETRHRVRRAITFFEEAKASLSNIHEDSDYSYLKLLIESSPSYNYVKKIRIKEVASTKFVAFERITTEMITESSEDGFDMLSGLFGNAMGLYESRKGKLYQDTQAKENIIKHLKPLDILLEKTPFRLTDKFIPGHFGHVAIWTGTKAELIDLDLWDNPYVKKHAEAVGSDSDSESKNEHQIIEALRSGVKLSTIDEFMNVDDFAILRPVFNDENKDALTKEALLMAFRQLGKKYDFNFDVNTTDKIVCSELAYVSFPSIDWPTEKTLGRHNISPDNVAKLAWNKVPLELVLFYHDGKLIEKEIQLEKMIELMKK
ncbi:YiiX/YebB-like N1pC/P60 family cysteine hydrolase [Seonamhaeicola sp. MEBiC1930]|uniref:YiiX/YebB-like N1pC/P60 family cysteine hydrolase n=1 Tax=Seonamhaeicola sp. MEBiC01930 TaxID=2976768 RepID=UPI0032459D58